MSSKSKNSSKGGKKVVKNDYLKPQSKASLANLTFPVARIRRYMKQGGYAQRVSVSGAVFLGGVLEYLAVEILELSGNAAKDNKQQRIKPRYIQLAIKNDDELCQLLHNVTIRDGGVIPFIHESLTKSSKYGKKGKSQKNKSKSQVTESQEF